MPHETTLTVGGHPVRVFDAGTGVGPAAVFFAGIGGLPRWIPFLDRLAEHRRVIVPSLPGFPGAAEFRHLDSLLDWIVHAVETLEALDESPVDLIGSSVGGALAAEVAALAGGLVNRLVLIAPFGVYDEADPAADLWAQVPGPESIPNLVCEHPDNWKAAWQLPEGAQAIDFQVMHLRAMEAAARLLFPFGDTGVVSRLHRVGHPALLLRGDKDRVLPASYNERFRAALAGPVRSATVADAGHLAELDAPDETARQIHAFLTDQEIDADRQVGEADRQVGEADRQVGVDKGSP